jgi:hypothetical protein
MKKTLLIVAIVILALGILGAGVAFAQGEQPPQPTQAYGYGFHMMGGPGMMGSRSGYGFMHEYVEQALAEKLGLTEAKVEDAFENGTTMYQLALDNGIAEPDLPAFMNEVHQAAFDTAITDGIMTQEQSDWMLERMQGMYTGGFGDCPMNGEYPQDGTGFHGMMGGYGDGRWQRAQP